MATKAFQKIYTKISQITKATCSLKATGVGRTGYGERQAGAGGEDCRR